MKYYIRYVAGDKTLFWHRDLGWVAPGKYSDEELLLFLPDVASSILERNFKALRLDRPAGQFELSLVLRLS